MADLGDPKAALQHYLQATRDDLIWKLEGLSEREARLPRTATGNNLLGVLKHCLNVEAGYFGPTFGREFSGQQELVPMSAYDEDPLTVLTRTACGPASLDSALQKLASAALAAL
jgi:hypothetical protein